MHDNATSSVQILLYGQDRHLVRTRGLLLTASGYGADFAFTPAALCALLCDGVNYRLAVLCHSTPADERQWITNLVDTAHPSTTLYCLYYTIPPAAFLAEVRRLVNVGTTQAAS